MAAALATLAVAAAASAQVPASDAALKADYLLKFADFIQWPAAAAEGPGAPEQLCVVGDDAFGAALAQALPGRIVRGRPIVLVRLDHVDKAAACQILFVGPSRRQPPAQALEAVRGAPVLTVTDGAADPAARGMIDFVVRDNRLRFRIDEQAAAMAGLSVSSKLLDLAVQP